MTSLFDPLPAANGTAEGETRRDAALYLLTATRPATLRRLQRAAVRLALEGKALTADDVRDAVPIPPGINPKITGAAMHGLAVAGILAGADYVRSRRAVAHARPLRRWLLADAAAALAWLSANPDYPADLTT